MRAIVFDGTLRLRDDYPEPQPKKNEALIRISCAGVCSTDIEITKGYMGFKGVPGHEFSGVIESAEDDRFVGKRVAGEINIPCGACEVCKNKMPTHCPNRSVLGILGKDGVFAEFATLPLKNLHPLPDNITDEEAVFAEPLAAAFEVLDQVKIDEDKRVAVLGDGRLGLLTAQVLALTDCSLVVIGRTEEKLAIASRMEIPARKGIEGFGRDFDIVVDCTGSPSGLEEALKIIRPRGTIVLKTTVAEPPKADLNKIVIDEITLIGSRCGPLRRAVKALEERVVDVNPLISKVFPLSEGVEAIKYASEKGVLKVIIKAG